MEDINEVVQKGSSVYSNVVNAGTNAGRKLAESDLKPESVQIIKQMQQIKEGARGENLADCARKVVTNAAVSIASSGNLDVATCKPDSAEVFREIGNNAFSRFIKAAFNGSAGLAIGMAYDAVSTAIETSQDHQQAIRLLAQKNFPGMDYQERQIDGQKVKVWSDAVGAVMHREDPVIKTYIDVENDFASDPGEKARFHQTHYRELAAIKAQSSANAMETAIFYVAENGESAMRDKIDDIHGQLSDSYRSEQETISSYRQSNMPQPSISVPGGQTP